MYDPENKRLIEELREKANLFETLKREIYTYPEDYNAQLIRQAADIIEAYSSNDTISRTNCNECGDATIHVFDMLRNMLTEEKAKNKWIPVSDPPPVGEKVIVSIHDTSGDTPVDYSYTGWFSGNKTNFIVDDEFNSYVTHWRPFPPPAEIK